MIKKIVLSSAAAFSTAAQAHTLDILPDGLAHELLHMAPVVVPAVLLAILIKVSMFR